VDRLDTTACTPTALYNFKTYAYWYKQVFFGGEKGEDPVVVDQDGWAMLVKEKCRYICHIRPKIMSAVAVPGNNGFLALVHKPRDHNHHHTGWMVVYMDVDIDAATGMDQLSSIDERVVVDVDVSSISDSDKRMPTGLMMGPCGLEVVCTAAIRERNDDWIRVVLDGRSPEELLLFARVCRKTAVAVTKMLGEARFPGIEVQ
jgi:hypothetical protein